MHIITLLPALLLLSGCQKDDRIDPPGGNEIVTFSGNLASDNLSRTALGDTDLDPIPVYWSAGDAIGVFTQTAGAEANNARATLTKGAGEQTGSFSSQGVKMAGTANVFQLYYPYVRDAAAGGVPTTESPVRVSGTTLNGLLPAVQEQKAPGVFDHLSRYGYAVATSLPVNQGQEVGFSMTHLLSYLELQLWSSDATLENYKIQQIEIDATGSQPLVGEFQSGFDGNCTATSSAGAKLTLNIASPALISSGAANAQKFLAVILPDDHTGSDLKVTVQLLENTATAPRTRTYTRNFEGADFASGTLKKINDDFSSWAMTTSVFSSAAMQTFLGHISALENVAIEYATTNPNNSSTYNGLFAQWGAALYLRQIRYTGLTWEGTSGLTGYDPGKSFLAYITASPAYTSFNPYFRIWNLSVPGLDADMLPPGMPDIGGTSLDVIHMMATTSALLYGATRGTLDDLAGWGGDLVTLETQILLNWDATGGTGDEEYYRTLTKTKVGRASTYFSLDDLISDIDAINLVDMMLTGMTMTEAMTYYYSHADGYLKRFTRYVDSFGTAEDFYNKVYVYTWGRDKLVATLYGNYNIPDTSVITAAQAAGIAKGYIDFIMEMAARE